MSATITDTLTRLRALEADHGPDSWPAVQMRDVSALLREVERLQAAQQAGQLVVSPCAGCPTPGRCTDTSRCTSAQPAPSPEAERLADALQVLRMVDDNHRVEAGERRKAWRGSFVVAEVRRVLGDG